MICYKCGKDNPEGMNFCQFCGVRLINPDDPDAPEQARSQAQQPTGQTPQAPQAAQASQTPQSPQAAAYPKPIGAPPYGAQPYNAQPYSAQPYSAQPYNPAASAAQAKKTKNIVYAVAGGVIGLLIVILLIAALVSAFSGGGGGEYRRITGIGMIDLWNVSIGISAEDGGYELEYTNGMGFGGGEHDISKKEFDKAVALLKKYDLLTDWDSVSDSNLTFTTNYIIVEYDGETLYFTASSNKNEWAGLYGELYDYLEGIMRTGD